MEHINRLITQRLERSDEQTMSASVVMLSDKQMGQVWERMAMMYGHRWSSNYGTEDDGTWRKGLAGLAPEQIGAGLVKCLVRKAAPGEEDWPPTLNEFRSMCMPERVPAIHRDYIALPKPPLDKDMVEKSLATIKEALT